MNNSKSIANVLVAGATGSLGGEICRQLTEKNIPVKALVRTSSDATKVAQLKAAGIDIAMGDLKDKSSLENALRGVSAVISTVSCTFSRQDGDSIQTVDDEGINNLIDAAAEAGVRKFIFVSFCPIPGEFPLQTAKRKAEKQLAGTEMDYTILQPTLFMESWLSPALGFDYPNAKATIYGDGTKPVSWIALKDVAAISVASLNNPAASNKTIELGGPGALSPLEAVRIFETKQGKKFELQFIPQAALQAQKDAAPDPLNESFAALMLGFANGSEIDTSTMTAVFPMEMVSVSAYAGV